MSISFANENLMEFSVRFIRVFACVCDVFFFCISAFCVVTSIQEGSAKMMPLFRINRVWSCSYSSALELSIYKY